MYFYLPGGDISECRPLSIFYKKGTLENDYFWKLYYLLSHRI